MNQKPRRSLTSRLTLLIASAASVILLLLGILIGAAVERHFRHHDLEMLNGKMILVEHALKTTPASEAGNAIPRQLGDALVGHADIEILVRQANGSVIFETANAAFPPDLAAVEKTGDGEPSVSQWRADDGRLYLGFARIVSTADSGIAFQALVATDISHQEGFMQAFRWSLWSAVVAAMLLTAIAVWYVVRREMRPLQAIRQEASGITARRLSQRLSVDVVPVELTQLVETLNEMLARLEESFQRLNDFSSDLAHELRTPVSNLLTQTQVTLTKARSADEYREILLSNTEELERLSRMIGDMLFLAQADHAMMVPNRESVNLAAEAGDVLDFYEALASDKQIAMTLTGAGVVLGDRLMLRRALSNLLSNAVRHTPVGGKIEVHLLSTDQEVQICIANTGDTIPAEQLPRLFDRFYRADTSRKRFSDGTGLGLAITDSIVRAHGGKVNVSSEDNLTRFTLLLPNAINAQAGFLDKEKADS